MHIIFKTLFAIHQQRYDVCYLPLCGILFSFVAGFAAQFSLDLICFSEWCILGKKNKDLSVQMVSSSFNLQGQLAEIMNSIPMICIHQFTLWRNIPQHLGLLKLIFSLHLQASLCVCVCARARACVCVFSPFKMI